MKFQFPKYNEKLPGDGAIYTYMVFTGDVYDALSYGGADIMVVTEAGPDEDLHEALLDELLRRGMIDKDDYDSLKEEDANQDSYYIEVAGPWNMGDALASTSTSPPDRKDLDVINAHRRRHGRDELNMSSGWSADELRDMAQSIRTKGTEFNPERRDELKRSLMK